GLTIPSGGTNALTISGTPTSSGTITFTVSATDAAGASATPVDYTLVVNAALVLTPSALPEDTLDVPYSQTIATSNGTGSVNMVVSNVQGAIGGVTIPATATDALTNGGTPTATV